MCVFFRVLPTNQFTNRFILVRKAKCPIVPCTALEVRSTDLMATKGKFKVRANISRRGATRENLLPSRKTKWTCSPIFWFAAWPTAEIQISLVNVLVESDISTTTTKMFGVQLVKSCHLKGCFCLCCCPFVRYLQQMRRKSIW